MTDVATLGLAIDSSGQTPAPVKTLSLVRNRAGLQDILSAVECPFVDPAVKQRLQRLLDLYGPEHVTLLLRTVLESEGNEEALIEPIVSAVSSVMTLEREWTNRGLAWIEAFDDLPLTGILKTMRDLDLFKEANLSRYMSMVLRNKLAKVFDPPQPPKAPRKAHAHKRGLRKPKFERLRRAVTNP